MATVTKGKTFISGETVEPADMHQLVDSATVTGIVNADIDAAAAIALSKLATGALPAAITVASANLVDGTIATADMADAAVTAAKLNGAQTGLAPVFGCRAWVNFNGNRNAADTGASTNGANVLIRASGNVASVLKNGVGDYVLTFTTAMPDTSYCVSGIASSNTGGEPNCVMVSLATLNSYSTKTDLTIRIFTADTNVIGTQDCFDVNVLIFR